jgi:PucR C-terminal helix-turn-helix domain/GGDEF-like domain
VTTRRAERNPRAASVLKIERASGELATRTTQRMDESLPWFREMPAEQRSWVGVVAQAGIASFVEWLRRPELRAEIPGRVFGAAPRELTRAITLHQTVELVRITVDVVEGEIDRLADPEERAYLREAILRYSREVAFAAAEVYAQTAEARGAWDARLEALVVDALLRGEPDDSLASRTAALGWRSASGVFVVVGTPRGQDARDVIDAVHRLARRAGVDALAGVHGARLVVMVGGAADPQRVVRGLLPEFGAGPVVVGPTVGELSAASASAAVALSGLRAVTAWPGAPRPVTADDLLPERALAGDVAARNALVEKVHMPLRQAGPAVVDTLSTYLEQAGSLEGTARLLFVHPNTVRYRLRRVTEVTGCDATRPRDAFCLTLALAYGRLAASDELD